MAWVRYKDQVRSPASPSPLLTPQRVAFAGDWHANSRWAVAAVEYAAERGADVIIHVGDFGYDFRAQFLRSLERSLAGADMVLMFVDGNHENFPTLLRYPIRDSGLRQLGNRIWHLPRGFRWSWGSTTLLALGGAHSVDRPWREPGLSWWREETITDDDIARAIAGGPVDVLVTHDCPAGVDIPGLAESSRPWPADELAASDVHRDRLRTVVDAVRPRAIWHGHFHRKYDTVSDFGYGPVDVHGLDCDGTTLARNLAVVDLARISYVDSAA
jgi:Calcineurin-like phosphoesterase